MATAAQSDNDPGSAGLTRAQIDILVLIERLGAGFSMVAITIIILSYILFEKIRTTPNLFLFCVALTNVGASVASMIGYDGLNLGKKSTLCQVQSFLFQWFMQADPWWSFAMAVNVYLVFFHNVRPDAFRPYAWVYCLICFGGPLITALVLIAIRDDPRGLIYGDAVLWCWIDSKWSLVRIYSYYIPVWICIFLSILIYVAVGYRVFHHRNQLRNVGLNAAVKDHTGKTGSSSDPRDSAEESLNRNPDSYGTAVFEVQVTTDPPLLSSKPSLTLPSVIHSPTTNGRTRSWVTACDDQTRSGCTRSGSQQLVTVCTSDYKRKRSQSMLVRIRSAKESASLKLKSLDPVKMAYLRTSFIFAFAVLITWIPSTINRLYSLSHNGTVSFQWSVASGCVLPLQGVWNALIYFTTTWATIRDELRALKKRLLEKTSPERRSTPRSESRPRTYTADRRITLDRLRSSWVDGPSSFSQSAVDLELDDYDEEAYDREAYDRQAYMK